MPLAEYINIYLNLATMEEQRAFAIYYKFNNGVLQTILDRNLCNTEITYKTLKSNDILSNLYRFNQARPINFTLGKIAGIAH